MKLPAALLWLLAGLGAARREWGARGALRGGPDPARQHTALAELAGPAQEDHGSGGARPGGGPAESWGLRSDMSVSQSLLPAVRFSEELIARDLEHLSEAANATDAELLSARKSLDRWLQPVEAMSLSVRRDAQMLANDTGVLSQFNESIGEAGAGGRLSQMQAQLEKDNSTIHRLESKFGNSTVMERLASLNESLEAHPDTSRLKAVEDSLLSNNTVAVENAMRSEVDARLFRLTKRAMTQTQNAVSAFS